MANTVIPMEGEHALGLEETIAKAPKKISRWVVGGLAAITLAAAGGILTSGKYFDNKPEDDTSVSGIITPINITDFEENNEQNSSARERLQLYFKNVQAYLLERYGMAFSDIDLVGFHEFEDYREYISDGNSRSHYYFMLLRGQDIHISFVAFSERRKDFGATSASFRFNKSSKTMEVKETVLRPVSFEESIEVRESSNFPIDELAQRITHILDKELLQLPCPTPYILADIEPITWEDLTRDKLVVLLQKNEKDKSTEIYKVKIVTAIGERGSQLIEETKYIDLEKKRIMAEADVTGIWNGNLVNAREVCQRAYNIPIVTRPLLTPLQPLPIKPVRVLPEAQPHLKTAYAFLKEKYSLDREDVTLYSCDHITRKSDWNRISITGDFGYNFSFLHPNLYLELYIDDKLEALIESYYAPGEKEKRVIRALEEVIGDGTPLFVRDIKPIKPGNFDNLVDPLATLYFPNPLTNDLYKIDCSYTSEEYYFDFGARRIFGHEGGSM